MKVYLTKRELAEYLGVTRQYVEKLDRLGKMPAPDALTASGRPLWSEQTAERLRAMRKP